MRLHPPQKEISLYEEGFGEDDILLRKSAGQRLSELLEKVEDPIVLAVDGPWGSGKSYFLKRWVGAHRVENGGNATTVYFDAFANDFLDDPLVGLTGAIGDRLPSTKSRVSWKKAKTIAAKLARPVLRIGAAAATAGATELVGPIVDAAIEAGGKEAEQAAEAFWRREDGRRAAMQQFRNALKEVTKDGTPLIIVVDELDRCKPDYALSVLEVVKHFFAVERVHFVLGVNIEALEHIVRVRYGSGVNAADYLKRFISLSMQLPKFVGQGTGLRAQMAYLRAAAKDMGIDSKLIEVVTEQLNLGREPVTISLRDIEKILTRLVILPRRNEFGRFMHGYQTVIVSLVIWQVLRPEFYRRAVSGTLTPKEIQTFFGIESDMLDRNSQAYDHSAYMLDGVWQFALAGTSTNEADTKDFARSFDNFGRVDKKLVSNIDRDFFGFFDVSD